MTNLKNLFRFGFLELKPYSSSPQIDVKFFLEAILKVQNLALLNQDLPLKEADVLLFKSYLERRKNGEPVAYIIQSKEFFGLDFKVSPACLIPRADSEVLTEEAIKIINANNDITNIVDLCTGSGCLVISILKHLPLLKAVGVDISQDALEIAKENAKNLTPNANSTFKLCNILEDDLPFITGDSIVISNPPYIKLEDISFLQNGVKDFEPQIALNGGADGLDFYHAIAKKCKKARFILLEIGISMGVDVVAIFQKEGYLLLNSVKDLGGVERVLIFYHTFE